MTPPSTNGQKTLPDFCGGVLCEGAGVAGLTVGSDAFGFAAVAGSAGFGFDTSLPAVSAGLVGSGAAFAVVSGLATSGLLLSDLLSAVLDLAEAFGSSAFVSIFASFDPAAALLDTDVPPVDVGADFLASPMALADDAAFDAADASGLEAVGLSVTASFLASVELDDCDGVVGPDAGFFAFATVTPFPILVRA